MKCRLITTHGWALEASAWAKTKTQQACVHQHDIYRVRPCLLHHYTGYDQKKQKICPKSSLQHDTANLQVNARAKKVISSSPLPFYHTAFDAR